MDKEQVYRLLTKELGNQQIKKDEPMCKHTSLKIGGNADIFIVIKEEQALKYIMQVAKQHHISTTFIGNGTNLLVKDNGIRGIVAQIGIEQIQIEKQEQNAKVILGAGVKNAILAQMLLKEEIAGFEFAAGIPGTIGGAIYMNAGAYGSQMQDIVKEVTYMDENTTQYTISNEACKFAYRTSMFQNNHFIITKVVLELPYGNKDQIKQKMEENKIARMEKQPYQMPSAGSSFKRGKDFITAKLIDECGLKGYQIGGAQVSTKHAGFIVNTGGATAKDVIELIKQVQKMVLEKCEKQIELEIKIIGE